MVFCIAFIGLTIRLRINGKYIRRLSEFFQAGSRLSNMFIGSVSGNLPIFAHQSL